MGRRVQNTARAQLSTRGALLEATLDGHQPRVIEHKVVPPPLLVSGKEARRLLDIGATKYFSLLRDGKLTTVLLGRRRHVTYESIMRLVGGGSGQ